MPEDFQLNDEELQTALKVLSGLVRDKLISVREAAQRAGLTEEEFVERTKCGNFDVVDCHTGGAENADEYSV